MGSQGLSCYDIVTNSFNGLLTEFITCLIEFIPREPVLARQKPVPSLKHRPFAAQWPMRVCTTVRILGRSSKFEFRVVPTQKKHGNLGHNYMQDKREFLSSQLHSLSWKPNN
jgi:hypothetical protein